jgi:hypothetical protein
MTNLIVFGDAQNMSELPDKSVHLTTTTQPRRGRQRIAGKATDVGQEDRPREGEEIMKDGQEWDTIGILDRYVSPWKIERNRQGRLRVYHSQESSEQAETFLNFTDLGEKNLSWLWCVKLTTTDPAIVSEYENALKRKQDRKTVRVVVSGGIAEVDEDTLPAGWCYEIIDEDEEEDAD